jgi:hypothetical protein
VNLQNARCNDKNKKINKLKNNVLFFNLLASKLENKVLLCFTATNKFIIVFQFYNIRGFLYKKKYFYPSNSEEFTVFLWGTTRRSACPRETDKDFCLPLSADNCLKRAISTLSLLYPIPLY